MKRSLFAVLPALSLASSLAWARPLIQADVKEEVAKIQEISDGLRSYQQKAWAVGLNGDTLQPDQFAKFFADRLIPFDYFVRSQQGLAMGEADAYRNNQKSLNIYRSRIIEAELADINCQLLQLKESSHQKLSIGVSPESGRPDELLEFFAARNLPFEFYVQSPNSSFGNDRAYASNILVLETYQKELQSLLAQRIPVESKNP